MSFLIALLFGASLILPTHFLTVTSVKDKCVKQGYFIYTDIEGNQEKHECK